MAESGLYARASNWSDSHRTCKGSFGIFQIGCVHETDLSVLYDVEKNIKLARAIYDESKARTGNGWLPWGAYTNQSYKSYLAMR